MVISQEAFRLAEGVSHAMVDAGASRVVSVQRQKCWARRVFPREVAHKLRCLPNR